MLWICGMGGNSRTDQPATWVRACQLSDLDCFQLSYWVDGQLVLNIASTYSEYNSNSSEIIH